MPLRDSIADLGRRIEGHGAPSSSTPSYLLYVYPPKEEWSVRRDLNDLRLWLEARKLRLRLDIAGRADVGST